jgi:UDP-3-O-[3-hydroxymyristoyl] glucosamine N-acyltransferase
MVATAANDFIRHLRQPATARAICAGLPGSTLVGDPAREVVGIGALSSTAAGVLTFCDARDPSERLAQTGAAIVVVPAGTAAARADQTLVAVADVRAGFIDIVDALLPGSDRPPDPAHGVAAGADIDPSASIAPGAHVAPNVRIGARTRIGPGAVIYDDCEIGADCVIGPGAIIGWVGLAYHDRTDGRRSFFPHLAGVRVGERVDIGAQASVCRGMLSHTRIGDDAKIGSLVYVSHGVLVGERAWLSAGTAVAGHARVAAGALLGIGSVVVDNINLDEGVLVGGGSVVTRHAAAGEKLYGVPARPVRAMRRFGPTPRE